MNINKADIFSECLKRAIQAVIFLIAMSGCLSLVQAKDAKVEKEAKVVAGETATPPLTEEEYSEKVKELMQFLTGASDSFVYSRVGRADPFMPFVSERIIAADFGIPREKLTGMRKFEPGQLSLVAIVFAEDGPLAMVQDSIGKGYVIRNGTKIGRSGIVDGITDNLVVVKQRYKNTAGDDLYKTVQMLLKKEGEQ